MQMSKYSTAVSILRVDKAFDGVFQVMNQFWTDIGRKDAFQSPGIDLSKLSESAKSIFGQKKALKNKFYIGNHSAAF